MGRVDLGYNLLYSKPTIIPSPIEPGFGTCRHTIERGARLYETLLQFNLKVEKCFRMDNILADAVYRYAYPATSSRKDVCFHGSAVSHTEVT